MTSKPVRTFREGAVGASIFISKVKSKKDKKTYEIPSVSLRVSFKKDGEWGYTNKLDSKHIPGAINVLKEALEYLKARKKEEQQK